MVEKPPSDQGQADGGLSLPKGDCLKDTLQDTILMAIYGLKGGHEGEPPRRDIIRLGIWHDIASQPIHKTHLVLAKRGNKYATLGYD